MKRFHAESLTPIGFVTRCFLLLPPAFLIGLKYDIPHVPILTFLLILLPLFRKKAPSFGKNALLFFLSVAVALALIPSYMFEVDPGRITPGDVLLRAHIFVPLLLYAAAFACGLRRSREITSFIILMVLFTTLICGGLPMANTLFNTRFPLSDGLLHMYRYTYMTCAALQFFGILLLLTAEARMDSVSTRRERGWSSGLRFLLFLVIPCLMVWETGFYLRHESDAKKLERFLLYRMRRMSPRRTSFASNEVRIVSSMQEAGTMPVGEVLLRVRSPFPPGYLRGRVYDSYSQGVWRISSAANEQTELLDLTIDQELSVGYYPFHSEQTNRTGQPVEIFFARSFRTDYFPIPPRAAGVEMVADSASLSADGVLFAKNPSRSAGYIARVPDPEPGGAFQSPENPEWPELRRFLAMPRGTPTEAARHMGRALVSPRRRVPPREAMYRVESFLRDNYLYSLDPGTESRFAIRKMRKLPPPDDPVERFLIHTGAGHCELFASSAVLILRSLGIPARYVTGFVCGGPHPDGVYYVTDRDAHAWAEAYDRESGKWILLDPTPSVWQASAGEGKEMSAWESFQLSSDSFLDRIFAYIVRGYAGRQISEWLRTFGAWLSLFVREPWGIAFLLTSLLCAGLLTFYIRRVFDPFRSYPPEHRQSLRVMMKLERRLALRMHRSRKPEQTWTEWAGSFRDLFFGPALMKLTARYEQIRYRPADPARGHDGAKELSEEADGLWKQVCRGRPKRRDDG